MKYASKVLNQDQFLSNFLGRFEITQLDINALVAALIVFTFAAYERHHTALGSLAAITGTFIKLFPLAGVSFAMTISPGELLSQTT